ncbi:LysR substrate-binding domain-containing protein [Caldimonas brevitalea]|uniref:Transcriptional regulator n=1 Tax=Caldimonas brevitalea TaxID=413882 RepID=A0A0G3BV81_9BURK|nr:LysR substrate-binding domain-containing protein [Caldimonas brevitalea]AKJ31271.1 transcriptional regulator [Caldimonas brevitalea]
MAGEDFLDPRIEFELLLPVAIVAVVAAGHPLAQAAGRGTALGAAELVQHLQIVLEDPTDLSEGRDFGVLSPQTLRVQAQEAKRALILAGAGWGRLPRWSIERELAEGQLVSLPLKVFGRRGAALTATYLARRMDQVLGPAGTALRDALHRRAREFDTDGRADTSASRPALSRRAS